MIQRTSLTYGARVRLGALFVRGSAPRRGRPSSSRSELGGESGVHGSRCQLSPYSSVACESAVAERVAPEAPPRPVPSWRHRSQNPRRERRGPGYLFRSGPPANRSRMTTERDRLVGCRNDAERQGPVGRDDLEQRPVLLVWPRLQRDAPAVLDPDRLRLSSARPRPRPICSRHGLPRLTRRPRSTARCPPRRSRPPGALPTRRILPAVQDDDRAGLHSEAHEIDANSTRCRRSDGTSGPRTVLGYVPLFTLSALPRWRQRRGLPVDAVGEVERHRPIVDASARAEGDARKTGPTTSVGF